MKKYENGQYIEMTEAEAASIQAAQAEFEEYERTRPRTTEEILADLLSSIEVGLSDG